MNGVLHNYIQSLIAAALLCSLAMILTPEGRVKKAVILVCGVVMLTALILPLVKLDYAAYSKSLAEYRLNASKYADSGNENRENLNRVYIEEQCRAYILDKAENLGAKLSFAKVNAEWSTDGFWYPISAEFRYECSEADREQLASVVEAELGISKDNQTWSSTNEA